MLQPDLFFAYGLSSGMAVAAGKQLKKQESIFVNKYFLSLVLWLSIFYIPQVFYLLWRFPAWESMFVAKELTDIPPWLISLYPVAVMAMGILGFFITARFIKQGKVPAALAQAGWSMAAALILITVGWDGTGYQRLFYIGSGADWANHVPYPLMDWFTSPIARTLTWLETIVMVPYIFLFIRWARGK
ncbi:MAG TPA: hypothetical protein VM658_17700 [bacterium]|nr:hypothetical protein [bacterium]